MSRNVSAGTIKPRPSTFSAKSFTRFEPLQTNITSTGQPHRAATLQASIPSRKSQEEERPDVFNKIDADSETIASPSIEDTQDLPDKFDELPIELASLTDRFIESLSEKVHDRPADIDTVSSLFQDFYIRASSSISIHISSLISRLNRESSPNPSRLATKSRPLSKNSSNESLSQSRAEGAQQMLTATEVAEKRRARKLLEYKRLLLEEAVEKRACEMVYHKIWRHKSTLDDVRDEKLRSKTAALALVGIGLRDLGIELNEGPGKTSEDIQQMLIPARDGLMRLSEEKCPLGKLQHLTAAHKAIVDTLYSVHGSSSSADEILPTLIYTLITSPTKGIDIISNLNFIQRFRTASKVDGEAAYCLTNLEAAISFLEHVDLASLRADELPEGPKRSSSRPDTPTIENAEPFPEIGTDTISTPQTTTATSETTAFAASPIGLKAPATTISQLPRPRHQRTLSDILQPLAATNEAVRNTAREGIENISNTLDNSFKFLFGRLREQAADPTSPKDVVVPKTLDEARLLVSKAPGPEEDLSTLSDTSSFTERDAPASPMRDRSKSDDKLMTLFGGKRPVATRERSVDSSRSTASSKRVAFSATTLSSEPTAPPSEATSTSNTSNLSLNAVKNMGSSLNPLSHIGNAFGGGFRGFGRPAMPTSATLPYPVTTEVPKELVDAASLKMPDKVEANAQSPDKIASRIRAAAPPIKKFMDASTADDLKVGEVTELLDDYKRLARLLGELANPSATGK